MPAFNLTPTDSLPHIYQQGLLPQRNQKGLFYQSTSCRSNLHEYSLSSENRRILKKTDQFHYERTPLNSFTLTAENLKTIHHWLSLLKWDFPTSSVKTVFNNHIFNELYIWQQNDLIIGYAICLVTPAMSHIAYVFYDPSYQRLNLPIRMVLQVIVDSYHQGLDYCYLGQFSPDTGFYKRNMPGFEVFDNGDWVKYTKNN
ncbi:hypothetical protein M1116_00455 [Patescibacteria group bacterium]|nr:hypothetical protein [Patescibacteria group bacterium]